MSRSASGAKRAGTLFSGHLHHRWGYEVDRIARAEHDATVTPSHGAIPDGLVGTGETFRIAADQALLAIGQSLDGVPEGIEIERGKIKVNGAGRTSIAGVWAGGDCASGGDDLTVTAVAEGRDAAEDIHAEISG